MPPLLQVGTERAWKARPSAIVHLMMIKGNLTEFNPARVNTVFDLWAAHAYRLAAANS